MGNVNAADDAKRYRDGYPGKQDDPRSTANLEFYSNKRASKPDGDLIENIHESWKGKYSLLEAHHGYIQWLFPIREDGLNHHAEQLTLQEAKAIKEDPVLRGRIITSYELMLDFYGMKLVDRTTGKIERNPSNWKSRYEHLNHSFHNYLRITRILKCLGEVGLEHFKLPFVQNCLIEIFDHGQLTNCYESCVKYWATVLRNDNERTQLEEYILQNQNKRPQPRGWGRRANDSDSNSDSDDDKKKKVDYSKKVSKSSEGEVDKTERVVASKETEKPVVEDKGEVAPDHEKKDEDNGNSNSNHENKEDEKKEETSN